MLKDLNVGDIYEQETNENGVIQKIQMEVVKITELDNGGKLIESVSV